MGWLRDKQTVQQRVEVRVASWAKGMAVMWGSTMVSRWAVLRDKHWVGDWGVRRDGL